MNAKNVENEKVLKFINKELGYIFVVVLVWKRSKTCELMRIIGK